MRTSRNRGRSVMTSLFQYKKWTTSALKDSWCSKGRVPGCSDHRPGDSKDWGELKKGEKDPLKAEVWDSRSLKDSRGSTISIIGNICTACTAIRTTHNQYRSDKKKKEEDVAIKRWLVHSPWSFYIAEEDGNVKRMHTPEELTPNYKINFCPDFTLWYVHRKAHLGTADQSHWRAWTTFAFIDARCSKDWVLRVTNWVVLKD